MSVSQNPGEPVDHESRRLDFDLDEWLLKLVIKDHPDWRQSDGSCAKCRAEVQRMNERAERLELL